MKRSSLPRLRIFFWRAFAILFGVALFFVLDVSGQRRDHLTAEEIEIVRDVQKIDLRTAVFVKAIERRILAITGTGGLNSKQLKTLSKDRKRWGELPKGEKEELLSDIDKILDEAINKLEDVAERDIKSDLFPAAVYILADNCGGIRSKLEAIAPATNNPRALALIDSAISQCRDVIESTSKINRPDPKKKKKRKRI